MQVAIKQSTIKSVSLAMAKNDIRYYLNGLHIETNGRETRIVATDGHRMNVARVKHYDFLVGEDGKRTAIEAELTDIESVIIPAELVKSIVTHKFPKSYKHSDVTISTEGDKVTATVMGGVQYSALRVDGKFPDWRRVVPDTLSGEHAEYNPEYVFSAIEAWRIYCDLSKTACVSIARNGTGAGGIFVEGFAAIIMPWRTDGCEAVSGMADIKAELTVKPKLAEAA